MSSETQAIEDKMSDLSLTSKVCGSISKSSIAVLSHFEHQPETSHVSTNMHICQSTVLLYLYLYFSPQPLTERTDKFVLTPPTQKVTLAALPPDYRPIPCKPLFFDLALNHVEFPPLGQRVEKKQGGITGFMKGLLWGSGKS